METSKSLADFSNRVLLAEGRSPAKSSPVSLAQIPGSLLLPRKDDALGRRSRPRAHQHALDEAGMLRDFEREASKK